ncbi:MAG: hypothetical protein ABI439_07510 [Rhodospirillales bacterium]
MMDLLPLPHDRFACPHDGVALDIEGWLLPGMIPFARTHCGQCRRRYLAHLHVGFCGHSTLVVEESTGQIHDNGPHDWYRGNVVSCMATRQQPSAPVTAVDAVDTTGKDVILVNTLDPTYGHNLGRIYVIPGLRRQYPDAHIVAIVGRFFAWMTPDDVDESWIVETSLRHCADWNDNIATLTAQLCGRAKRVRYSNLHAGPTIDISQFTRIKPFTTGGVEQVGPARIGFHLREDRNWTYRGLPKPQSQAIAEQLQLVMAVFDTLHKEDPEIECAVTGYGRSGAFPDWVKDLRIVEQDSAAERRWMEFYARSHLAVGIHGSHMVLPCAHAMGAIQIPLTDYWSTSLDLWEWVNRYSAQEALVRYLRVPVSTSLSETVSIIFTQLLKLQQMAGFDYLSRIADAADRERFTLQHHRIFKGGYPLQYRDHLGRVL